MIEILCFIISLISLMAVERQSGAKRFVQTSEGLMAFYQSLRWYAMAVGRPAIQRRFVRTCMLIGRACPANYLRPCHWRVGFISDSSNLVSFNLGSIGRTS